MKTIAQFIFKIIGWKVAGRIPGEIGKFIIIVAPHTSNWDFVIGVLAKFKLGLGGKFLGKHTLFRPPHGWIFRALGGAPVDRSKPHNTVDQVTEMFRQNEKFILVLAPEGTRKKVVKWKTGFYYIALKAKVPIVKVAMDYKFKTVRIAAPFYPTGNKEKDLTHIYNFYKDVTPLYPEKFHIPDHA